MKSNSSQTNHRRAFTLVELLVVLVIVAALSALGFMGATRALKSASKSKSMANVRQLVSATQIFSSENNSAVMDYNRTTIDGQKRVWAEHLIVTMNADLATNEAYKGAAGDVLAMEAGIFSDPASLKKGRGILPTTGHNSWRTYAYNNRIGTYSPDVPGEAIPYKQGVKYNYQVESPDKLILFSQRKLTGKVFQPFLQPEDAFNDAVDFELYDGKAIVGFYDGHVEMLSKKNYPSKVGVSVNASNGKSLTQEEWRLNWWGAKNAIN